ncbi:MAG: hypothetical protein HYU39_02020, partial [Thaumarchaeota archaeon]|nr:hypothetical protein [Nitrososphaerota archaeon]
MTPRSILSRLEIAALILLLLTLSITGHQNTPAAETPDDNRLAITLAPPRVTADKNSYEVVVVELQNRTGFPTPISEDVRVILTSSRVEVGIVEQSILIGKGSTFGVAKFTSTSTPGETIITAIATGYIPASKTMITVEPSGTPALLSVALGPSQIPPQSGGTGTITVQLLDVTGMPARAQAEIKVTLASSLTRIGTVDPSLIISAESTFGIANFYTGFTVGETTITASASGYGTGSAVLKVVGPLPSRLAIRASAPVIPAGPGSPSIVTIQIQDPLGVPAKAPSDIAVTVTSSVNSSVFVAQRVVTIRSGESYTSTEVLAGTGGAVCSSGFSCANVTASAAGYESAATRIDITPRVLASSGKIGVYLAPPEIPPATESTVVIQLHDLVSGLPVVASRDIDVFIASSNTTIGTVDPALRIRAGMSQGSVKFRSTLLPGTTLVTAHATNFDAGSAVMSVVEAIPYKLALRSVPRLVPADAQRYDSIIVELQDINGGPARAPSDIVVFLSSSRTDVGSVSETVTLSALSSHAIASFRSTLVAGVTNVTASALGYVAAPRLLVTSVKPAPSQISVYASPATIRALQGRYETVVVQLQDNAGVPAKAKADTVVFLSSTDPAVGTVSQTVTIPVGKTFARAGFNATDNPGTTTVTATASGFSRGSATIRTVLSPMTVRLSSDIVPSKGLFVINPTSTVNIKALAESQGKPLSDATVVWSSTAPLVSNETKTTDRTGSASMSFRPVTVGNITVRATFSKPGYSTSPAQIVFTVRPLNLTATLQAEKLKASTGETVALRVAVTDVSGGVRNASLRWTSSIGSMSNPSRVTDASGQGTGIFFSNSPGLANVTVSIEKTGYTSARRSAIINVTSALPPPVEQPPQQQPSLISGLFSQLIFIVPVVVIAVVG